MKDKSYNDLKLHDFNSFKYDIGWCCSRWQVRVLEAFFVTLYKRVQGLESYNPTNPVDSAGYLEHWIKPPVNCVIGNCDAAIFT
ncbi:hypothetical protein ACET3Z_016947 [Daucus carota]